MQPFAVDPSAALEEVTAFSRRLAAGVTALGSIGEVTVGSCEKDVVYHEDKLTLYHYRRLAEPTAQVPLLICYALVNRPYMMDLQQDRSLIRGLLQAGLDVYLVDWGYPDGADRFLTLDDYLNGYLDRCVDHVRRAHGLEAINLLGVCQGGTMSLCYASLHPGKVKNLITMVTPVDFQTPDNLLSTWARALDGERLGVTLGNIPGELLNVTFLSLMPFRLTSQKYVGLADIVDDTAQLTNFLRMEKWIFDSPDQAGEAFREFITWMFKENRLVKGTLEIGGRKVDLSRISVPVLNVYAAQDHLVPPAASLALEGRTASTDYSTFRFDGGHIGIYVSGKAQKTLPQALATWLEQRDRPRAGGRRRSRRDDSKSR